MTKYIYLENSRYSSVQDRQKYHQKNEEIPFLNEIRNLSDCWDSWSSVKTVWSITRVLSRKMIVNTRVLALIALVTYGVCAYATDVREPYKRINGNKYTGSMLAELAKEFIQRSTTSSQVIKIKCYYVKSSDVIIFKQLNAGEQTENNISSKIVSIACLIGNNVL